MTNARPNQIGTGVVEQPGSCAHDTAPQRQNIALQLRRRRVASLRCEPLADGRRDPWSGRDQEDEFREEHLDGWARALAHLQAVGLVGLPPRDVRDALAANPERYAAVLPWRVA